MVRLFYFFFATLSTTIIKRLHQESILSFFLMCTFVQGADWGDDGVLLFDPHTGPVGCLAFSRAHPTHLLSLSYDGSLRCMDVEKSIFDDVRYLLFHEMYFLTVYIV